MSELHVKVGKFLTQLCRAAIVTTAAEVALTQTHGRALVLAAVASGYALCWLRRDWRITRLAKRCTRLEGNWRKAARERDAAQIAEMAVRVENEHLTDDLATAAHKEQVAREQLGYVSEQLAQRINHPSQRRDAELFERLEKDFS